MTTTPQSTDIIKVTRLGHTFKASRYAVAWLDYLEWQFKRTFPKARLVMLQSCYNDTVAASAGTHNLDRVFDLWFVGHMPGWGLRRKGLRFARFMRFRGAAAGWFRRYGEWKSPAAWHFHGFPLPPGLKEFSTEVGLYVDGGASTGHPGSASSQLVDYVEHNALGLADEHTPNDDPDRRLKPRDLHKVVFNYHAWTAVHGIPHSNAA